MEGSDSVKVTDNNITVTRLSYTESHTVSVVATSAVCPGVLNSSSVDFPVIFNVRSECNQCMAYPAQGAQEPKNYYYKLLFIWELFITVSSTSYRAFAGLMIEITP